MPDRETWKDVPSDWVQMTFNQDCECDLEAELKTVTVTPQDIDNVGIPNCPECNRYYKYDTVKIKVQ